MWKIPHLGVGGPDPDTQVTILLSNTPTLQHSYTTTLQCRHWRSHLILKTFHNIMFQCQKQNSINFSHLNILCISRNSAWYISKLQFILKSNCLNQQHTKGTYSLHDLILLTYLHLTTYSILP